MASLKEKLDLWVKITGVNPTEKKDSYTIFLDGRLSDYDIKKMNDRITESLKYDESGMFAEAYLKIYLTEFVKKKNVSLLEMIENNDVFNYINDVKNLYEMLKESDASSVILSRAKKAMEFYNLPFDLDVLSVMELNTSAINCINGKLDLYQISAGNSKKDGFKLCRDIYMFDSLDTLVICSAKGLLNGVSLGYIQDKENLSDSFFAFIIKNGDNLYLLSDMPKYSHAAQKGMKRCPGRDMSNRIESNWFPYSTIANIDISDLWDTGRYGVSKKSNELSTNIREDIPYTVIGNINSLDNTEAFWFITMLSLIKEKFYDNEIPILPLSYTRSMINSPLLEATENTLVVRDNLPSMDLKEIDIEDTENLVYDRDFGNEKPYQYLIDRYGNKVDKTLINIIADTDRSKMIEDLYSKRDYWGKKIGCEYLSLNLDDTLGTKEDIEYRQKWIARFNFAKAIREITDKEYEEKSEEIVNSIRNLISPRIEEIVKMHMRNELTGYKLERTGFDIHYSKEEEVISSVTDFDKYYNSSNSFGKFCFNREGYNKPDFKCAFTGKKAGVVIEITPRNAKELALMCGVKIEELPIELQNYDTKKTHRYYGNCILDNIDPFLWVIADKFNELTFDTTILLSKTQYIKMGKEIGIELEKFWEQEKPYCYRECRNCDGCSGNEIKRYEGYNTTWHLSKKCVSCKWYKENCKESNLLE